MELSKAACEAAVGAFMERLTDKPTTGDLLAALRFALEAYESVRVAPAPAGQQEVPRTVLLEHEIGGIMCHWNRTSNSRYELCRAVEAEVIRRCCAQRTDKPS